MAQTELKQIKGVNTGSVVFLGANGVAIENNSNFFWDNTNYRLGIGTLSSAARVHIQGSGATSATQGLLVENSVGTQLFKITDDGNVNIGNATPFANSKFQIKGSDTSVATSNFQFVNSLNQNILDASNDGAIRIGHVLSIAKEGTANVELLDSSPHDNSYFTILKRKTANVGGFKVITDTNSGVLNGTVRGFQSQIATINSIQYGGEFISQVSTNNQSSYGVLGQSIIGAATHSGTIYGGYFDVATTATTASGNDMIALQTKGRILNAGSSTNSLKGTDINLSSTAGTNITTAIGLNVDITGLLGTVTTKYAAIFIGGVVGIGLSNPDSNYGLHVVNGSKIQGSGTTSATTSLLVHNSLSTQLFKITDDGVTTIGSGPTITGFLLNIYGRTFAQATSNHTFEVTGLGALNIIQIVAPDVVTGVANTFGIHYSSDDTTGVNRTFAKISAYVSAEDANTVTGGLVFGTAKNGNTYSSPVERMRIDELGRVSIGNISASAKFHIQGEGTTSATTALIVENSAGTDILIVKDDNKINIATPLVSTETLNVGGTVLIEDILYTSGRSYKMTAVSSATTLSNKIDLILGSGRGNFTTTLSSTPVDGQTHIFRKIDGTITWTIAPGGTDTFVNLDGTTANPTLTSHGCRKYSYRSIAGTWYEIT